MSVWTRPENDTLPLIPAEWRDAAHRWASQIVLPLRLPLALTGGLLAALGVLLALMPETVPRPVPAADIGAGAWTKLADAPPRFGSRATEPRDVGVWMRETNEGRETEDRLAFGRLNGDVFMLVIAARRPSAAPTPGFFVASVRAGANAGLAIGRFGGVSDYTGRFGPTEVAHVTLTNASERAAGSDCLAWRASGDRQDVELAGFLCQGGGLPTDTKGLECALRDLVPSAGSDNLLRQALKPPTTPAPAACKATIADASRNVPARAVTRTRQ